MNYAMAMLAERLAEKLSEDSGLPTVLFHEKAYETIMAGKEEVGKILSEKEIKETGYYEEEGE